MDFLTCVFFTRFFFFFVCLFLNIYLSFHFDTVILRNFTFLEKTGKSRLIFYYKNILQEISCFYFRNWHRKYVENESKCVLKVHFFIFSEKTTTFKGKKRERNIFQFSITKKRKVYKFNVLSIKINLRV